MPVVFDDAVVVDDNHVHHVCSSPKCACVGHFRVTCQGVHSAGKEDNFSMMLVKILIILIVVLAAGDT